MSEAFDPYHKWLGIPPEDQPPNHYRLLAVNPFEADPDVISAAADQRMVHVRTFQTGAYSAWSQRLLNEIAAARVCLLDPGRKAAYDQGLRQELASPPRGASRAAASHRASPPPLSAPPPSAADFAVSPVPDLGVETRSPTERFVHARRSSWRLIVVGAVTLALLGAAAGVLVMGFGPARPVSGGLLNQDARPPVQPGSLQPRAGSTSLEGARSNRTGPAEASRTRRPALPFRPVLPAVAPPPPTDLPQNPTGTAVAPAPEPAGSRQRSPIPESGLLRTAEQRLAGILTGTGASVEALRRAAAEGYRDHAERFVLLQKAQAVSEVNGDLESALAIIDEIDAQYVIDPLLVKAEVLIKLKQTAGSPAAFRAIAQQGLSLMDATTAAGRYDLAATVADVALFSARRAEDAELIKQITLRVVAIQERTPG